uniref:Uncharacterized protein n=1 Tax=Anguilla anguilla TaxID=7936 RepID=A0A0E9UD68_ANGAN
MIYCSLFHFRKELLNRCQIPGLQCFVIL